MATRLIDLPFTTGINESADETVTALPAMTELVNYRLTRSGRLEHRLGVDDIDVSTVVNGGVACTPVGSPAQAIHARSLVAGGHVYTYTNGNALACAGSVSRFVPWNSQTTLVDSSESYSHPSIAAANGKLVVLGTLNDASTATPNTVVVRVIDEKTGTVLWTQNIGVTAGTPTNHGRVVVCGSRAVVVFHETSTETIYGTSMDLDVLPYTGFPAPTLLVNLAAAAGGMDACSLTSTSYGVVYYSLPGTVTFITFNATTHAGIAARNIAAGLSLPACYANSTRRYLAWVDTTGPTVQTATLDTSLAVVATTAIGPVTGTFRPVVGEHTSGGCVVGYSAISSTPGFAVPVTSFVTLNSSGGIGSGAGPLYGYALASKPFLATGQGFNAGLIQPACWLVNTNEQTSDVDRSHMLVTLGIGTDGLAQLDMTANPSAGPLAVDQLEQVPEVVYSTATGQAYWHTALLSVLRGKGTANQQQAVRLHTFGDAAQSMRSRTRQVIDAQNSFAVPGGLPRYYDGAWSNEIGFPCGPSVVLDTPGGAGAMTPSSVYRYVFVLEYYDAQGQRCLSYASSPYSVTLGAGNSSVTLEILVPQIWGAPNAAVSDKRSVSLRVYRTAASVGTVFRFVPINNYPNGIPAGPYSYRVTVIDTVADADIADQEAVYVQVGNAVSNYRAPACRFGTEHEGRLVVAGGWEPGKYYCSKTFLPGEGIQFGDSEAFTGTCPEAITGLASLDGSLIVFSERGIYTTNGDGPYDDGTNSFPPLRRLPGRVGCVDWRSVVVLSDGVLFRSADGIYLLPRGLSSPSFVGAAVKNSLRRYPETFGSAVCTKVTSDVIADLDSEQTAAWLVGDFEAPFGETVLFMLSLATNTWSQVRLPQELDNQQTVVGVTTGLERPGTDAMGFVRKNVTTVEPGAVLVESTLSGAYSRDISTTYEPLLNGSWKTGKIFPFGFGGRGSIRSIRLVGECLSATTLTPTVYSDVDAAGYASDVLTFTPGRFQVEIPFRRRDLAWVQIRVQDPTTGSENRGAGLRFNGLALEVEMESGLHRTTPGERST